VANDADIKIGADLSPLDRALRVAQGKIQAFGASLKNIGASLQTAGLSMAGVGALMASPFILAIKAASDAEETANKFDAVFGGQADAANMFVDQLSSSIGRGRTEIRNGMAMFQGFFAGLDFDPQIARQMSEEITSLGYDLGSFFNLADDESMTRLMAGLSGEAEPLKRLGIVINEVALKAKLAAMGISGTATEQQKVMARFAIIRETMARQGAIGDALKTADGFANTLKRVKAQAMDLAIAIGSAVLPPVTAFAGIVATALTFAAGWARENSGLIQTFAGVAVGLIVVGGMIATLGVAFYAVGIAVGVFSSIVGFAMSALGGFGLVGVFVSAVTWMWTTSILVAKAVLFGLWSVLALTAVTLKLAAGGFGLVALGAATTALATKLYGLAMAGGAIATIAAKVAMWLYAGAAGVGSVATTILTAGINLLVGALVVLTAALIAVVVAMPFAALLAIAYYIGEVGVHAVRVSGQITRAWDGVTGAITSAFSETSRHAGEMFDALLTAGTDAFGGLRAALKLQDWESAWEIAKAAAFIAWEEISFFFVSTFTTWKDTVLDIFDLVWLKMQQGWNTAFLAMKATALYAIAEIAQSLAEASPSATIRNELTLAASRMRASADKAMKGPTAENERLRSAAHQQATKNLEDRTERDFALQEAHDERAAELRGNLEGLTDAARARAMAEDVFGGLFGGTPEMPNSNLPLDVEGALSSSMGSFSGSAISQVGPMARLIQQGERQNDLLEDIGDWLEQIAGQDDAVRFA